MQILLAAVVAVQLPTTMWELTVQPVRENIPSCNVSVTTLPSVFSCTASIEFVTCP